MNTLTILPWIELATYPSFHQTSFDFSLTVDFLQRARHSNLPQLRGYSTGTQDEDFIVITMGK